MSGQGTRRSAVGLLCAGWLSAAGAGSLAAQTINFTPIGSISAPAQLVKVQGERAYLAAAMTLTIVDISNPSAPKSLGAYTFPDRIRGFRLVGRLVYVAADRFGLGILDVSNDRTPILRGSLKTPGQAMSVAVSGSTALVTDVVSGLDVVNVSDLAKPVLVGSVFLEGFATDVVTSDSLVYAADRPTGFYVFDLSKPGPLEPMGMLQSARSSNTVRAQLEVLQTSAQGPSLAVLVTGRSLHLFEVSNPVAPVNLLPYRTPGGATRLALKDQLAYVADGREGLQVVDLSTASQPRIVGAFRTESPAFDVAVADSIVLLALASGEVLILRQAP